MFKRHAVGFTLIELLVTISLLGILLALGLPTFQESMRSNRLATSSNELMASLSLARSEAIRNNRGSAICPSADGTACDGAWGDPGGLLVWSDDGAGTAANATNGALDAGEVVLRYTAFSEQLNVSRPAGDVATLVFDSRGRLDSSIAGTQAITLQPDPCPENQALVRILSVNSSGQVNVTKENCE